MRTPMSITFRAAAVRGLIYLLILAGLMQGVLIIDAGRIGGPDFSEVSFTEITQALLLLGCLTMMLYVKFHLRILPSVSLLLWAFFTASLIRENDLWLDQYLFDGAWQVLVTVVVLPSLIQVWRRRHDFAEEFATLANTFGFGLFAGGFLTTYLFSRLYGRGEFWRALMGDGYLRVVKDAAEEVTELAGYSLLLFACIEIVILASYLARRGNRRP